MPAGRLEEDLVEARDLDAEAGAQGLYELVMLASGAGETEDAFIEAGVRLEEAEERLETGGTNDHAAERVPFRERPGSHS